MATTMMGTGESKSPAHAATAGRRVVAAVLLHRSFNGPKCNTVAWMKLLWNQREVQVSQMHCDIFVLLRDKHEDTACIREQSVG